MRSIAFIEQTIVDRIKEWTKNVVLFTGAKNLQGEKLTSTPNVYRGFLPIPMTGVTGESLTKLFPHIVVQMVRGHHDFKAGQVDVCMFMGCWDDEDDRSGYQDVINLIEVLKISLYTERHIADEFPLAGPLAWELGEKSDSFPAFSGMLTVTLDVETPSSRFDAMLHGG